MIFGAFAVGLRAANLETDVEKLWVEGKKLLFLFSLGPFLQDYEMFIPNPNSKGIITFNE